MPLQKARANQALEAYCQRLEELFSEADVCVTALFIDVIIQYYGYRTTVYDELGQPLRCADFCFPYYNHCHVDVELRGVRSDLYGPGKDDTTPSIELYSEFPNEEPSDELIRTTARAHAEYAFFYLTDSWAGDKFKLNELVPKLKFIQREKEQGVDWLKFERKELEAKDLYGDQRHNVQI